MYFYVIRCPLYANIYLIHDNITSSNELFDRESQWGSVYTCEFVSFAYLSAFVVSFISLWIHIVFRRVLRTERLLRLPIGLFTLVLALIALVATISVTDGVIKFCSGGSGDICSSNSIDLVRQIRWQIFSLPAGMISFSQLIKYKYTRLFQVDG